MISFRYILIALLVLDLCWWLLVDLRLRASKTSGKASVIWRILVGLLSLIMIGNIVIWLLPPVTSARFQAMIPDDVTAAVYVWHILAVPVGCIAMLLVGGTSAAWRGVASALKKQPTKLSESETAHEANRSNQVSAQTPVQINDQVSAPIASTLIDTRLSRREMIGLSAASVGPLILAAGTSKAAFDLQQYDIDHRTLFIPDLPHEFEGLTIAHLSDLHHGRFTDSHFLDRVAETVNLMHPDLMLFTGDLIDRNLRDLPAAIAMCKKIRATEGIAFCVGNHDLFESRPEFITQMHRASLPLLIDNQMDLSIRGKKLRLVGLDWERNREGIPESSRDYLTSHDASVFSIALVHHPHAFDLTSAAGIPLTLSGHTHGGQMMLTPEVGIGSLAFRYWSGLYQQDKSSLVVSNGVGNWFPVRINAPAEISKLTLKRA